MRLRILVLSGVDGAGKSTQLAMLDYYLRSKGLKTYYLWLRWFSVSAYLLYFYARIMRRTIIVTRSRPVHVHLFWIDKALRILYPRFLLLDLLLWFLLNKFAAWIKETDVLIIDRGFLDVLVDLLWETRNRGFLRDPIMRLIWKITSNINTIIFLVEPREAVKRKNDIISIKEIVFKKKCFEILAKYLCIPTVNTSNKSIINTFKEIVKLIKTIKDQAQQEFTWRSLKNSK